MARPMKAASPDEQTTVSIRMPGRLRVLLEQEAAANHRTLSAEAERRVERSFSPDLVLNDTIVELKSVGSQLQPEDVARAVLGAVYGERHADVAMALLNALAAAEMAAKQGGTFRMAPDSFAKVAAAFDKLSGYTKFARKIEKHR
jgi:hypothetical protein